MAEEDAGDVLYVDVIQAFHSLFHCNLTHRSDWLGNDTSAWAENWLQA